MTRLITGVGEFRKHVFDEKKELFEELQAGQSPLALFITCADSRIDPNLLTQTAPGELFVLRNAGNMVAPFGDAGGGEGATIEYAVTHLKVRDIILCGHSRCGAMQGLLNPAAVSEMREVAEWLRVAEASIERAKKIAPNAGPDELLDHVIEQNVILQVEHLLTYPAVMDAATAGRLRLHAWVYRFEIGQVTAYNARMEKFISLADSPNEKLLFPIPTTASSSTAEPKLAESPATQEAVAESSLWNKFCKLWWPAK
jgi:carbonic anhydrase